MKKFVALILGCITICGLYGCSKNSSQIINKTFSLPAYNRIEIDSANDDIKIISGKHYRVRYVGQNKLKPTIKVKNGVLVIDSPKKSTIINGNIFGSKNIKQTLTIEMPKKELKYLAVDTSNGDISVDYLEVQKGTSDTSNGNVNLKNLITKKDFEIDTSNGTVKVGKSNVEGYALSTSNGSIVVKGENKSDEFEKNTSAKNVLSIDTSNGNIYVN